MFDEIARLSDDKATLLMQQIDSQPMKDQLVLKRIRQIK